MVNISGWGAFWLMIGVVGVVSILTDAVRRLLSLRQIVKILDQLEEEDKKDLHRELADDVRKILDKNK